MEKRNYSVDLFRIIAAFFVIVLHIIGKGGILKNTSPDEVNYWMGWFLEIGAYCAVNCFALISGYLMVNKTIKAKNIIALWIQVLFYSLLLSALFFVFLPESRNLKNLALAFIPIMGKQWWYISAYFALFFLIPILNAAINNISKGTLVKFLLVILIGVCVIDCGIPRDPFAIADGYSTVWLMLLYFFGAYIRKYDLKQKVTTTQSALAFVVLIIVTFLSKVCIYFATKKIFGEAKLDNMFISYTSITIVLAAISLFLFCLNVKVSNSLQKVILFFSPATLGVYLIHVHPLVFEHIIKEAFADFANKPHGVMLLCVLATALVIFMLCSAIDLVRIWLFKLIKVDCLCEMIDDKITKIGLKAFKK